MVPEGKKKEQDREKKETDDRMKNEVGRQESTDGRMEQREFESTKKCAGEGRWTGLPGAKGADFREMKDRIF